MGKDGRFIIPRVTWVIRDKDHWVLRADAEITKTYAEIDRRGIIQLVTAQFNEDSVQSTFEYTRETQRAIYAQAQGGAFTIDNVVSLTTGKNREIKVVGKKDGKVTEMDLNEERITHIKGSHIQPGKPGYAFEYFADGLKGWYRVGKEKQVKMEKIIRVVRETDGWVLLYKEGEFEHEAKLTASGLSAFSCQLYDAEADREFYSADEDLSSYSASPH